MSSNSAPLTAEGGSAIFRDGSDVICDQRDAGSSTEATSAAPVGCRLDEVERNPDEQAGEPRADADPAGCRPDDAQEAAAEPPGDRSSETAQAGPSDRSPNEITTPASSIKSRRDLEAFLRNSGFSRSVAKSIAASGWPASEETEAEPADLEGPLSRLLDAIRAGSN